MYPLLNLYVKFIEKLLYLNHLFKSLTVCYKIIMNIILIIYLDATHTTSLWCGFLGQGGGFLSWFLLIGLLGARFDGTMWCSLLAMLVSRGMLLSAILHRWP